MRYKDSLNRAWANIQHRHGCARRAQEEMERRYDHHFRRREVTRHTLRLPLS